MSEIPQIPVPSIEKINRFPWASASYFMMGIIAFLLYVVLFTSNSSTKQCGIDKAASDLRADRAIQQMVAVLQANVNYNRKQDSLEYVNRRMRDTLNQANHKLNQTATLAQKAATQ